MSKNRVYVLHAWVEPGGSSKSDYYYLTTSEEVKKTLLSSLRDPYLAVWYGLNLTLYICEEVSLSTDKKKKKEKEQKEIIPIYQQVESIDMLPFIKYQIGKFAPIEFLSSNSLPVGYFRDRSISADDEGPINFESRNVNEVNRYLKFGIYELFRKMEAEGITGTNEKPSQPDVSIEISEKYYDKVPDLNGKMKHTKIYFKQHDECLNYGLNRLG